MHNVRRIWVFLLRSERGSKKEGEKNEKLKKYLIVLIIFREIVPIKLDFQYINEILQ